MNENAVVADRLEEVSALLEEQGADRFRVAAWRNAARTVRRLPRPIRGLFDAQGVEGLEALPDIGETIARAIATLFEYGRLPMLDRLRGQSEPEKLLTTVPGIGQRLARRIHEELGIDTLEALEAAAHEGRLESVVGIRGKRLTGIRDSLAQRLGRIRPPPIDGQIPSVAELLDIDREYRSRATHGELPTIAPRRFNPSGEAWLPVLHTQRKGRHYTVLFSNTARAHALGRTRDWVVLYADDGGREGPWTVITSRRGALRGERIVAGREQECAFLHAQRATQRRHPDTEDRDTPDRSLAGPSSRMSKAL